MNRRIKWNQTPPNFDDYAPECLQSGAMAPFQQGPPALDEPPKKRTRSEGVEGNQTPKAKSHPKPRGHGFSN